MSKARIVKVFIGRFQPFHNGHLKVLKASIATADHVVLVLGSGQSFRTPKNPWNATERCIMALNALSLEERAKVSIVAQADVPESDEQWVRETKRRVQSVARKALGAGNIQYTLVGCHKGTETYYLELYKGWGLDSVSHSGALNATDIRRAYFRSERNWARNLPGSSAAFLSAFALFRHDDFMSIRKEFV